MTSLPDPHDDLRLPRPPGVVQRFWARHTRLADWLIALFWGLPVVLVIIAGRANPGAKVALAPWVSVIWLLLVAASCIGIFVRRTRPVLALAILSVALVPAPFTDASPSQILPAFGVYSLAVYRSNGAAWIGAAFVEGASLLYSWLAAPIGTTQTIMHDPWSGAVFYAFELLVALAIGATVGNRRRYLAALIGRARQLARERDQQAQLSAAAERARIARDMHDVVSHSLTVMVTLSEGAAAAATADAGRAAAVMRQVADTGREALTGMRQMLGVLGGDGAADLAPQPTAAELPQLIERFRQLGVPVNADFSGELPTDPALQLAVYRVVQEGLTNALRYAQGPTAVTVSIAVGEGRIVVAVDDDGLPGIPTPSLGAGRGLIGLAERVSALGGTVASGPHENGAGWRVTAELPLAPADRKDSE